MAMCAPPCVGVVYVYERYRSTKLGVSNRHCQSYVMG